MITKSYCTILKTTFSNNAKFKRKFDDGLCGKREFSNDCLQQISLASSSQEQKNRCHFIKVDKPALQC